MTYILFIAIVSLLFVVIFFGTQIGQGTPVSNSDKKKKVLSVIGLLALLALLYPSLSDKLKK